MTDPDPTPEPTPEPDPTPAPDPTPEPVRWSDGLPEVMQTTGSVQGAETLEKFVDQHLNQAKLIGRKGVIKPGEDGTDEQWSTYYNEMGRPEEVGGYELPEVPEGLPVDETFMQTMLGAMHGVGITNEQASAVFTAFTGFEASALQMGATQLVQAAEDADAALHATWGAKYDENVQNASKVGLMMFDGNQEAYDQFGNMKLADGTILADNPIMIQALANVGKHFSEDALIGAKTTNYGRTPAQANTDLSAFRNDEKMQEALWSNQHPDHEAALATQDRLYRDIDKGEEIGGQ